MGQHISYPTTFIGRVHRPVWGYTTPKNLSLCKKYRQKTQNRTFIQSCSLCNQWSWVMSIPKTLLSVWIWNGLPGTKCFPAFLAGKWVIGQNAGRPFIPGDASGLWGGILSCNFAGSQGEKAERLGNIKSSEMEKPQKTVVLAFFSCLHDRCRWPETVQFESQVGFARPGKKQRDKISSQNCETNYLFKELFVCV